jgi:hypothetical protein
MSPQPLPKWAALLLLASVLVGCAAQRRNAYIHEQAGQHVYRQPLSRILPHVEQLLDERGYLVGAANLEGLGARQLHLHPDAERHVAFLARPRLESLGPNTRYFIVGQHLTSNRSAVLILRIEEREDVANPMNRRALDPRMVQPPMLPGAPMRRLRTEEFRDLGLEWELMQLADPKAAQALKARSARKHP